MYNQVMFTARGRYVVAYVQLFYTWLVEDMFRTVMCTVCGRCVFCASEYVKHRAVNEEAGHILSTANTRDPRIANPQMSGSDSTSLLETRGTCISGTAALSAMTQPAAPATTSCIQNKNTTQQKEERRLGPYSVQSVGAA